MQLGRNLIPLFTFDSNYMGRHVMEKLLITGGNGFIGRYLCRECEKRQMDYLTISDRMPVDSRCGRKVDLLDYAGLREALAQYQPDAIVNLAAIADPIHGDPLEFYRVNVGGTENLLRAAGEVLAPGCRVVLISTAGVYGNQQAECLNEDSPFNPINHYSYSKMVTELLSRQYSDLLDIHIVRPFNIIGYGQKENFFVPKLVKHFANRTQEIQLGNLGAVRDYVSVEFCSKVLLDIASADGDLPGTVNVCTGVGYSCQQVIDILQDLTRFCPKVVSTAQFTRSNEVWRLVGDTGRLERVVKSKYTTLNLPSILQSMLKAYQNMCL